jgi:hypothetical protein
MAFLQFYTDNIAAKMKDDGGNVETVDGNSYYKTNPASLEGIGSAFNKHIVKRMGEITSANSTLEITSTDNPIEIFIKELIALNNIQQFYQKTINIKSYEVIDEFMKSDAYKILKDGV